MKVEMQETLNVQTSLINLSRDELSVLASMLWNLEGTVSEANLSEQLMLRVGRSWINGETLLSCWYDEELEEGKTDKQYASAFVKSPEEIEIYLQQWGFLDENG